jgi:hypothetical protein
MARFLEQVPSPCYYSLKNARVANHYEKNLKELNPVDKGNPFYRCIGAG